jgi:hypothetical protein
VDISVSDDVNATDDMQVPIGFALWLQWARSPHALDALYGQLVTAQIKANGPRGDVGRAAHVRRRAVVGAGTRRRW